MPEGLPYFKFTTAKWQLGKVALEDYYTQGLFINICAYYWAKSGLVGYDEIRQKFRARKSRFQKLVDKKLIKVENDLISISFLDRQLETFEHIKKINSANGKLGGRKSEANATEGKAIANQSVSDRQSIGDKEKEEDKEEEGEEKEKEKGAGADALLPGPLQEKWVEWEQHLREKKCRLTPSTKKLQIEKLRAMTPSLAVATINYSITNGYTGLFEERPKQQNGKRTNAKQEQAREGRDFLTKHYNNKPGGKKI
jgi:hypothetical protein